MGRFCFGWKALHPDGAAGGADTGEPKNLVQLSQQRLDELIGKAFAKGVRRGRTAAESAPDENPAPAREAASPDAAAEDTGDSVDPSAAADEDGPAPMAQLAEARDTLRLANQRLLEAMVMQQAQHAGLSARGAAAALQMANLSECLDCGVPSESRVKNRLQDFAASWPEFALCAPPPPFAAGTGSGSIQQDVLKNALGVL